MNTKTISPVHPGEILLEEFLIPLNLSQNKTARALGIPPRRINEIVLGKRSVTVNTALRLAKYFDTTPKFWINLQTHYDLEIEKGKMEVNIQKIKKYELI